MSKDKAKLKAKKRRNTNKSANVGKNQQCPKCKKVIKPSGDDGISESEQPAQEIQTNKPKTPASNGEPKNFGNVQPTPSLSDQEQVQMYEDSEDEPLRGIVISAARPISTNTHWPTFADLEKMFADSDADGDED